MRNPVKEFHYGRPTDFPLEACFEHLTLKISSNDSNVGRKSKVWASQNPLVSLGSGRPLDPYFPSAQRRRSVGSVAVAIHVRGAAWNRNGFRSGDTRCLKKQLELNELINDRSFVRFSCARFHQMIGMGLNFHKCLALCQIELMEMIETWVNDIINT